MERIQGNASVWVVVALLIVAAVLLFAFSDEDSESDTATTTDETTQVTAPGDEAASTAEVQEALSAGGSLQCAFVNEDGAFGTSYVSDSQIRVVTDADGVTSNMIFVDGDIYVWDEGAIEGISFSADAFSQYSGGAMLPARPADITAGVDSGDVACSVVEVDEEMFMLPETVTFASYATSSTESDAGGQLDDRN
ncbi:MAG: hypothetical protein WD552_02965 [Candidatus Paceibacterota bacterium]